MSDAETPRDIFAGRSHADRMEAQGRFMSHAKMAGHVAAAANVVMGHMPAEDPRHAHSTEYLTMLAEVAERAAAKAPPLPTKWDRFLGWAGLKEVAPHTGETAYIAIRGEATAQHTIAHGGDVTDAAGGMMSVTDQYTFYEPGDGIVAGSARTAVDSVMTGLILGEEYPAGARPQEPPLPQA
jgi:hypothetical protein